MARAGGHGINRCHNPHEQHAHGAKPRQEAPLMAKKLRLVEAAADRDALDRGFAGVPEATGLAAAVGHAPAGAPVAIGGTAASGEAMANSL
jgi:hypothetical protein